MLIEPFYALIIVTLSKYFKTTTHHCSQPSVATCEACNSVVNNFWTKKEFCLYAKFIVRDSTHQLPVLCLCSCQTVKPPKLHHPCPIFFKMMVSGEAFLTCDPSCELRVGRKKLQQVPSNEVWSSAFVPEHEWEWERPQGSCWPKSMVCHTNYLTSDVKTSLVQN